MPFSDSPNDNGHDQTKSPALVGLPSSAGFPQGSVQPWSEGARGLANTTKTNRTSTLSSTPDALSLLVAFRRRWLLALTLGVLAMVTVGGLAFAIVPPSKYIARSYLHLKSETPIILAQTNEATPNSDMFRKNQVALIKTPRVIKAALRYPKVARLPVVTQQKDPVEWLKSEVKLDFIEGSDVLQISMSGDVPVELEILVNAVTQAYLEEIVEDEERKRVEHLNKLTSHFVEFQTRRNSKRKEINELVNQLGTTNANTLALKDQLAQEDLSNLRSERDANQRRLRDLLIEFRVRQSHLTASKPESEEASTTASSPDPDEASNNKYPEARINASIERDPGVTKLREEAEKLRGKYDALHRTIRDASDPAMRDITSQYQKVTSRLQGVRFQLRAQLEETLAADGGAPGAPGAPAKNDRLLELKEEIEIAKARDETLTAEFEKAQKELKLNTSTALDLENQKEEITIATDMSHRLGQAVETLKLEIQAPARIVLSAAADLPKQKDDSKKYKLCLAASGGAFAFALLSVSFWEFRARRVNSIDEIVNGLGMNLVGALPALPQRKLGRRSAAQALEDQTWQSVLVESVDATRTMLLHMSKVEGLRSVMICSAMKGEGKTSLSVHLATSLARAGQRTLLIDCDLRSPSVNKLYDLPLEPGLCEHLRGEVDISDVIVNVIRQSPVGELDLIPAGRYDAVSLQALARNGVRTLIDSVRDDYDFVIVDSAPVLPVADTLLISQQVDAVLFSILRDVSRLHHVQAGYERVLNLGVRILGAVVNGAPRTSSYGMYPYS